MATEADKYEGFRQKLENTCEENGLLYQVSTAGYPITLTIRPQQGLDAQLSMLEAADDVPFNSPDGTIMFIMQDGELTIRTSERFTLSATLFNKLKNLFLKMHFCYVQMFHRDVCEKGLLNKGYTPAVPSDNKKFTEPLEEFEEDGDPDEDGDPEEFPDELFDGDPENPKGLTHMEWMIKDATRYVRETGSCKLNDLMRKYTIGHSEAARLIEALEDAGVVGEPAPGGGRVVLHYEEGKDNA